MLEKETENKREEEGDRLRKKALFKENKFLNESRCKCRADILLSARVNTAYDDPEGCLQAELLRNSALCLLLNAFPSVLLISYFSAFLFLYLIPHLNRTKVTLFS